jgi:hypothetical protein
VSEPTTNIPRNDESLGVAMLHIFDFLLPNKLKIASGNESISSGAQYVSFPNMFLTFKFTYLTFLQPHPSSILKDVGMLNEASPKSVPSSIQQRLQISGGVLPIANHLD